MTILWPAGLPDLLTENYTRSREDGLIRSQFPGGTKTRPRFTKPPPVQVSAQVICTRAQLQTLEDFWELTLKQGSLPFMTRDVTKPDDTLVECKFLAPPRAQALDDGLNWRVSLSFEQLTTFQGTFPLGDGGGSLLGDGTGNTITT